MSRVKENQGFVCQHCGMEVEPLRNGSYRNHCPFCLYSIHIDHHPGDRSHTCLELMKPIEIKLNSKKGMQIIHQCLGCGERKANKVAEGDPQSDDINELINIMAR